MTTLVPSRLLPRPAAPATAKADSTATPKALLEPSPAAPHGPPTTALPPRTAASAPLALPSLDVVLQRAAAGPNADHLGKLVDSTGFKALPATWQRALVDGLGRPRTAASEGCGGVLSPLHVERVATQYATLTPPQRQQLDALLDAALRPSTAEADPLTEQALILKALAARPRLDDTSLGELQRFATAVHGLPRYALVTSTSLLDLDGRRNSSPLDVDELLAPKPRRALGRDAHADNDGLLQTYDASCGPTSVEAILGELDPVYAFAVHQAGGLQAARRGGLSDALQRTWVQHFGDTARRRTGLHDYHRLRAASRELERTGALTATQRLAVLRYCRKPQAKLSETVRAGLRALRRAERFPSDAHIAGMRGSFVTTMSTGTDDAQMLAMMRRLLTPASGETPTAHALRKGRISDERLGQLRSALAHGGGALISTTDHWYAALDARRDDDGWRYLLHDPWTGITAWVPEPALADGSFQKNQLRWTYRATWSSGLWAEPAAAGARAS